MVHGDDSGLVLPPHIAPVQTRVIPIAQHKEGVLDKANELLAALVSLIHISMCIRDRRNSC